MQLQAVIKTLEPRNPFRIALGEKTFVDNVFVQLESNGICGYGEASPSKYYGESAEDVLEKVLGLKDFLLEMDIALISDIPSVWKQAWKYLQPSRAALCAVDVALWDLLGKKESVSVSRLVWRRPAETLVSSCTLGISEPEYREARVDELVQCPVIKIKMDQQGDLELIRYVRSRTDAVIRVDANCSWEKIDIADMSRTLHDLGVEFIEQPLPPEMNHRMPAVLEKSVLPIIADESCVVPADVKSLQGSFSGINIKLVKCGGLTPGLEMLKTAKKLGLKSMVGCMLESNVLIAAGAVLAQKADYCDLDGAWLLKDPLFEGVDFTSGRITLSEGKGLGIQPTFDIFK
jgi:L-alanine-DL-glutamate epimerase-like enolase superfamily enzyme